MTVMVIMLVARVLVVAIFPSKNEQYLRGFVLALSDFVCYFCTETF